MRKQDVTTERIGKTLPLTSNRPSAETSTFGIDFRASGGPCVHSMSSDDSILLVVSVSTVSGASSVQTVGHLLVDLPTNIRHNVLSRSEYSKMTYIRNQSLNKINIVKDVAKISTNKLSTFDFFTFISFHFVFYLYENIMFINK